MKYLLINDKLKERFDSTNTIIPETIRYIYYKKEVFRWIVA